MSAGIHNAVLEHVNAALIKALITDIPTSDTARAGLVKIGPNQGDPSPDKARIIVSLFMNDPDNIAKGGVTGMRDGWDDKIESIEIGGATTHNRRFTIKGQCLFVDTRETEDAARIIASTVRERVEVAILTLPFAGVVSGSEYVSRGANADEMASEMLQAGGPPDAFQYVFKVRFSVLTTRTGV